MTERFFSTCPRGLEALLGEDLATAGGSEIQTVPGGAGFSGDWPTCYRANLLSRIATRVLWRVGSGKYGSEEDVYRLVRSLPWPKHFDVQETLKVSVTAVRSPLRSLDFTTLRIKDAICDRFRADVGARPSVDTKRPSVRVRVFLSSDEVTIYLDTSGDPLYKRGVVRMSVSAPLKENLAAGILRLSGWRPDEPLVDPMCGGGTFLKEAAQIALNVAPGLRRSFGFERLKGFDASAWSGIRTAAHSQRLTLVPGLLFGSDKSEAALSYAKENLAAAELSGAVQLDCCDVLKLSPPAANGILVTNPPYGVRLAGEIDLPVFYPRLGDTLKRRFAGWRCYLFSADPQLPKLIGLRASRRVPLFNGALECRLFEYRIVGGRLRGEGAYEVSATSSND
jgi:putative N6-adenine-specific DNA methylase